MSEPIYRAPMRARDRDVPGADFGLAHGLVGIGPGRGGKAERMIHRFATLPEGTFVWTRDSGGAYHLGRITGPWRQEPPGEAGLDHVRDTEWIAIAEDEVPAAVVATFARGGRNLQRTHDAAAERRTAELWAMRRSS